MNKNNKRTTTLFVVFSLIIVLLLGYIFVKNPVPVQVQNIDPTPPVATPNNVTVVPTPVPVTPMISGDTGNFVSFSIAPGATVSGKMNATGSIKGGYFFEAVAQGMLLDANKHVLRKFQFAATTDWMTSGVVAFKASIDATGIAPGAGYIRIANDNPSGIPANEKYIDIPVVFK
jgi:hypothetical protein